MLTKSAVHRPIKAKEPCYARQNGFASQSLALWGVTSAAAALSLFSRNDVTQLTLPEGHVNGMTKDAGLTGVCDPGGLLPGFALSSTPLTNSH